MRPRRRAAAGRRSISILRCRGREAVVACIIGIFYRKKERRRRNEKSFLDVRSCRFFTNASELRRRVDVRGFRCLRERMSSREWKSVKTSTVLLLKDLLSRAACACEE